MEIAPPLRAPEKVNDRQEVMMAKAREMETAFLAEMLGHAGLGQSRSDFGGGHGEEQFASFLKQEQAKLIVERGGIGLAEMIFKSMSGGNDVKQR